MKIEGIIYRLRRAGRSSKSVLINLFHSLYDIVKDLFYENLPSDDIRDLPSFKVFTLGAFIYVLLLASFLTFIIFGYIADRNSKFLAVDPESGECIPVSKSVNGQFLADINGEWEGSEDFIYSKAIYSFTMPNYQGNSKEYSYMMSRALESTLFMGQEGYKRNLAINVLVWTVFSSTIRLGGSANKFSMSGNPRTVFDRRVYSAAYGGPTGPCPIRPTVSYNTESAQLSLLFDYQQFISNPTCLNLINPHHLGYIDYYSGPNFQIIYDARSALTALAINYGLLAIDELELIPNTEFIEHIGNMTLTLGQYYYPRYPGMRPLLCMITPRICVLQIYETYLYPLFNHLGKDPIYPTYCDCLTEEDDLITGGCHLFHFVSSFAFFDYNASAGETKMTAVERLLLFSQTNSGEEINHQSFNASFYTVQNPSLWNTSNPQRYQDAFEFCRVEFNKYCTLLSVVMIDGFEILDGVVYNPGNEYTISDHYYQIRYGACNDTFTISEEARNKLIKHPPRPLQEPYFECRASKSSAFLNSWGVSSGNMATVTPILVMIVLTLFFTFSNFQYQAIPKTYSSTEKNLVLDYFAFNLLLIRDQRYHTGTLSSSLSSSSSSSIERSANGTSKSPLRSLFQELSLHERIPRFFYDHKELKSTSPPENESVLETTMGIMMTEKQMNSTNKSDRSHDFSVDAVMTESQYDQLSNPLFVPSPPPSSSSSSSLPTEVVTP